MENGSEISRPRRAPGRGAGEIGRASAGELGYLGRIGQWTSVLPRVSGLARRARANQQRVTGPMIDSPPCARARGMPFEAVQGVDGTRRGARGSPAPLCEICVWIRICASRIVHRERVNRDRDDARGGRDGRDGLGGSVPVSGWQIRERRG